MNKIIPFIKIITLKEEVDEITNIGIDNTLLLDDPYLIKGDLLINGCFKNIDGENSFNYTIPVEIAIDSKYDTEKCTIKIEDFFYEIINNIDLKIRVKIILDNLYYKEDNIIKEEFILEDNRNDTIDKNEILQNKTEIIEEESKNLKEENNEISNDLFKETEDDTVYSVYRVYTVLEGDTLESILDKYSVTREDIMYYNDLDNIKVGDKLIIPSIDE